jgi:mycothiol synthase
MADTGYIIRNYRPEDFDRYVLLCREAQELRPSRHAATPEIVRKWLAWPHYNPESDLFLLEKDGELIGGMDLRPEPDIGRVVFRCWIHPQHRRNGLGKQLFECSIQHTLDLGIGCIHVNVPGNNNVARTVLSRHGFRPIRRFLELKLDLALIDRKELEEVSHECRCLKNGQEEELARVQNLAFDGQWGYHPNTPETISFYTRLGDNATDNIILSFEEDKIISYCWVEIISGSELDDETAGEIHMIGSDPEYQGRGIGKKVLLAGLAYLKDKGIRTTYLSVDSENQSALTLYYSVGFELHRKTIWYEKRVS